MATSRDVSEQLAAIRPPGAFAARQTSRADDLRLEVKGVGPIAWPITSATARRLCKVARPARYGLKDQTRLDPDVRDTCEIPKSRVSIGPPYVRRKRAQGRMPASITRIVPAAFAHRATRPRLRP